MNDKTCEFCGWWAEEDENPGVGFCECEDSPFYDQMISEDGTCDFFEEAK
jgi:hypothetical protein